MNNRLAALLVVFLGLPAFGADVDAGNKAFLAEVASTQDALIETGSDCIRESEGKTDPLNELAIKSAGETTLATVELLSAYTPLSRNYGQWFIPKTLAFRLSTSVPATTGTLQDFGDLQLLMRDGALFNGYFSFAASPIWFQGGCGTRKSAFKVAANATLGEYIRPFTPDKLYLSRHPLPAIARFYFTHGIGLKALRTGLKNDETTGEDANQIAAAGTAFIGLGIDGPAHNLLDGDEGRMPSGKTDFQINGSATRINRATLDHLYGPGIDDQWVYAAGARYQLTLSKAISVLVDFSAPLGPAKEFMGSVTVFSIAYSLDYAKGRGLATAEDTSAAAAVTPQAQAALDVETKKQAADASQAALAAARAKLQDVRRKGAEATLEAAKAALLRAQQEFDATVPTAPPETNEVVP